MSTKFKIIVPMIGIVIITFLLIGLSYGYASYRIKGNTNSKSVDVNLKNVSIKYADKTGNIVNTNFTSREVAMKEFTITNNGSNDVKDYVIYMENVSNTLKEKTSVLYDLTCTTSSSSYPCKSIENIPFPSEDGILVVNDKIGKNVVHTYKLTIKCKNCEDEVGNKLASKLNIASLYDYNPYSSSPNSLAYKIVNNATAVATVGATGSKLVATPETKPAQEVSRAYEKELSITPDKYGMSYYYRGNVEDNYVTFANMCWRIVRIQGDGSVKLILQDSKNTCSNMTDPISNSYIEYDEYGTNGAYGSTNKQITANYLNCTYGTSKCLRTSLQNWFNSNFSSNGQTSLTKPSNTQVLLKSTYQNKIKYEEWEIGDWKTRYMKGADIYHYEARMRLENDNISERYATLIPIASPETRVIAKDFVSTLTVDEAVLAGFMWRNKDFNNYLNIDGVGWILLTPSAEQLVLGYTWDSSFAIIANWIMAMEVDQIDYYTGDDDYHQVYARPAIVLSPNVVASGRGTKSNPYVVS